MFEINISFLFFVQFDPVAGNFASERTRNLSILEKLDKAKEVLDSTKAANRLTSEKERRYCRVACPLLWKGHEWDVRVPVILSLLLSESIPIFARVCGLLWVDHMLVMIR